MKRMNAMMTSARQKLQFLTRNTLKVLPDRRLSDQKVNGAAVDVRKKVVPSSIDPLLVMKLLLLSIVLTVVGFSLVFVFEPESAIDMSWEFAIVFIYLLLLFSEYYLQLLPFGLLFLYAVCPKVIHLPGFFADNVFLAPFYIVLWATAVFSLVIIAVCDLFQAFPIIILHLRYLVLFSRDTITTLLVFSVLLELFVWFVKPSVELFVWIWLKRLGSLMMRKKKQTQEVKIKHPKKVKKAIVQKNDRGLHKKNSLEL